jgi:NDP-sugar pyrophosphorylase family protein
MKAMIFAAGLGTRLKPFTDSNPKALAVVNGKTLLERNIRFLQGAGITNVVVNVHHFAHKIIDLLQDNNGFGSNITISDETTELLETGGGLMKAAPYFAGETEFVVMNADVLTNLHLSDMIAAHQSSNAIATLAVMNRASSRQLLLDDTMTLCGWQNNATGEQKLPRQAPLLTPMAFSGIQIVTASLLADVPFTGKFSMIDVYLYHAAKNSIKGYNHTGDVFIDVGKPESIEKAANYFQ